MTESFESAIAFARNLKCWSFDNKWFENANCTNCVSKMCDRLQKAHDHEMEQLRRLRFHEGYVAGQRSMDAEHYAVALRLKHLPLDEDSHGNLSQIARAIWHSDFGWTKGACEALRDELVRLLGGVHDEPAQTVTSGCACDADCDCGHGDETAVAYDVLGNERQKAVCELRSISDSYTTTGDAAQFVCDMANAINAEGCDSETIYKGMRDRLIHLLGGDECNFSTPENDIDAEDAEPNPAETSDDASDHVSFDTPSITDELRKFKGHINAGLTPEMVLALRAEINCIADRIDEQFNHAMISRSAELGCYKLHINQLEQERDEARQECADLLDLLRDAVVDFEYASYSWNYALIVGENITLETERNSLAKERDELRKSLREIAERAGVPYKSDLSEYNDDELAENTLAAIDSMHEYIGALEWQRDRQKKLLGEYDKTHMKLPVDANGESVHVGDIMEYAEGGKPKEVIAVSNTEAFLVDDGPRYSSLCVHHAPVDTAENIVRDIHLGKVTDSQAIERIRALNG